MRVCQNADTPSGGRLIILKDMKKVYLAPQTEAIQMLGENAIMAGSGGSQTTYNLLYGTGDGGGMR